MSEPISVGERGEIRCFCSRSPLLGIYGVGKDGRPFIHVKIWKQNRLYGEFVFKGGELSIKCRDCYRWYRIFINDKQSCAVYELSSPEVENADAPLAVEPPNHPVVFNQA